MFDHLVLRNTSLYHRMQKKLKTAGKWTRTGVDAFADIVEEQPGKLAGDAVLVGMARALVRQIQVGNPTETLASPEKVPDHPPARGAEV